MQITESAAQRLRTSVLEEIEEADKCYRIAMSEEGVDLVIDEHREDDVAFEYEGTLVLVLDVIAAEALAILFSTTMTRNRSYCSVRKRTTSRSRKSIHLRRTRKSEFVAPHERDLSYSLEARAKTENWHHLKILFPRPSPPPRSLPSLGREFWSHVFVGKIHVALPVIVRHVMFAVTQMVANSAHDGLLDAGPFLGSHAVCSKRR